MGTYIFITSTHLCDLAERPWAHALLNLAAFQHCACPSVDLLLHAFSGACSWAHVWKSLREHACTAPERAKRLRLALDQLVAAIGA